MNFWILNFELSSIFAITKIRLKLKKVYEINMKECLFRISVTQVIIHGIIYGIIYNMEYNNINKR